MKQTSIVLIVFLTALQAFAQDNISIIHGPYLQNVSSDEATIVWVASKNSVGWVEILPDDNSNFYEKERQKIFDSKNGIKKESRVHKVRLQNLKPGTKYRYRVYATEVTSHESNFVAYGRTAATVVYKKEPLEFRTLNPEQESVSFAMVNDMHGDSEKLAALLGLCDMDKTDMIMFVGDMVSIFNSEEQVFGGFMDKAVEMFASEKPMFYTRGNHETRGNMAYDFQEYFSPSQEHIYYMFRQGPVCIVALDSGEDKPDSDIEYSGTNVYEQYRSEQAEWLERIVQSETFKSAPFKIVTCHIPPVGGWFGNEEVASKFIPILNKAGIDLMLCGHMHKHLHLKAGEKADFPVIVNSNTELLKCSVSAKKLNLQIMDRNGRISDSLVISK